MRSLRKQRRIQVLVLIAVALVGSTALIGYAMRDGINFFRSPSQVVETPPRQRKFSASAGLLKQVPWCVEPEKRLNFV